MKVVNHHKPSKRDPGRPRGLRPLTARLTQKQLVKRIKRQLVRAAAAIENAPKSERKALQERLWALRATRTVLEDDQWVIRAPLSRKVARRT